MNEMNFNYLDVIKVLVLIGDRVGTERELRAELPYVTDDRCEQFLNQQVFCSESSTRGLFIADSYSFRRKESP